MKATSFTAPDMMQAALAYAAAGVPVFPCKPDSKAPFIQGSFQNASADTATVEDWWNEFPDALIGVPTGHAIGMWVLDVDNVALFEPAAAKLGLNITGTAKSLTGKGYHLFYNWNPNSPVGNSQRTANGWPFAALEGAEVRGEGGYIIVPPSTHPNGKRYKWEIDQDPAESPAQLLEIVRKVPPISNQTSGTPSSKRALLTSGPSKLRNSPYGMKALQAECSAIQRAPNGGQESALNEASLKIGRLVAGGELHRGDAIAALVNAGLSMTSHNPRNPWTAEKVETKVARGIQHGMARPRSAPTLHKPGEVPAKPNLEPASRSDPQGTQATYAISPTPYGFPDPKTIRPREWKYGRWLLGASVTAFVAPGGGGKSTLVTTIALALATGHALLGTEVNPEPQVVWIYDLENPQDEIERSVSAAMLHFNVKAEDLGNRLYVDSAIGGQKLCVAKTSRGETVIIQPVMDALIIALKDRRIDVLIIDPFVSSHKVDENNNPAIDEVVKMWSAVAVVTGCSIVLVHHTSKAGSGEVTAMSSRGAVSMIDACRSVLVLNRMSKDDARKLGVEEDHTWRYFSVHDDKHSRAPAENAEWFKLVSVSLGNETDERPSDVIGVATSWRPSDPLEDVTPDDLRKVQALIQASNWRESIQSHSWAGYALANIFGFPIVQNGLKPQFKQASDKARASRMLAKWIENGALRVEEGKDPDSRKDVKFVRVGSR